MTSYEKYCVKWDDFQANIAKTFHDLREGLDFSDVTLVCEEDKQVEAHKVILSVCSPFFSSVLKKNKHPHPIIYMRGLKSKDLLAIIDFIYHGEAKIRQEDLDGFFTIAEELQLKGLTGPNNVNLNETNEFKKPIMTKQKKKKIIKQENLMKTYKINEVVKEYVDEHLVSSLVDTSIVPFNSEKLEVSVYSDNGDLQATLTSMMESITEGENKKWRCTVCGKSAGNKKDIRRHVESHIEGVSHPCTICGKVSRSSNVLKGRRSHSPAIKPGIKYLFL